MLVRKLCQNFIVGCTFFYICFYFAGVGLFNWANGTDGDVQNKSAWLWNETQRGSSHTEENVGWDPEI